jgi:hypothetical protein
VLGPRSIMIFGIALLLLAWLGAHWKRPSNSGVLDHPPAWLRHLVGASDGRVQLDDLIVGIVGLLWLLGGAWLALTGKAVDSPSFTGVVAGLIVLCLVGGLLAFAVWVRRLAGERHR